MRTHHRREEGTALVAALLFSLTLVAYAASLIGSGVAMQKQSRYLKATQKAQEAAESGVHFALARLAGPYRNDLLTAGEMDWTMKGSGTRAPRFRITLSPGGLDGLDNDVDGFVDEPDEADTLELISTGSFDGISRSVYVTILARYQSPAMAAAAYIADPTASLDLRGAAFLISGYDVDLNAQKTGDLVAGIGVAGDPTYITSQVNKNQITNVVGLGNDPSILQVDQLDMQELIEEGARSANIALEGDGTYTMENEGDWGTIQAPAIVYGRGSIHVSGGAKGAGIMIVNGDLEISGSFQWIGLIIVRGQVILAGGGGGKRLLGSLIVEKDVTSGDSSSVGINGTVDLLFSAEAVTKMSRALASYSILNWREGPNPKGVALP